MQDDQTSAQCAAVNPERRHPRAALGRRGFLGLGAAAGSAALLLPLTRGQADASPSAAGVAKKTGTARAAARPTASGSGTPVELTHQALGVNATGYDSALRDAPVADLLRAAGMGLVRYPGGSNADSTNWQDPTLGMPWPAFMNLMRAVGAAPMVTINYASLSQGPESAGAWVADALTYANYDPATAVWVLGNEGYGPWEPDQHPDPHTPESYATNVRPYFQRMHAVDPRTRVGFPMTIDRAVAGGTGTWVPDPDAWNNTVLGTNADEVNFIDFHWYPVFGIPLLNNADLFATADKIPGALDYLHGVIDKHTDGLPIVVSESNISQSEIVYNTQPVAALYAVVTALRFLSLGAQSYLWWQVHNSDNMNGDFGFLSNGTGSPGPTATTLTQAAAAGDRVLHVADDSGLHYAHRIDLDTGRHGESRKITALPGSTTLASDAPAGSTTVHVTNTETLTTTGSTTDRRPLFAPGTVVTVGTVDDVEQRTVVRAGTAAATAALAAPAAAGDRTIKIVGVGMGGQSIPVFMPPELVPGAVVQIGTGGQAETAVVKAIDGSSTLPTALAAAARAADTVIHVEAVTNTNTGLALYVGDDVTIDDGRTQEVRTIATVGTGAAGPTELVVAVKRGDRRVYLASVTGVTAGHPLRLGDPQSSTEIINNIVSAGTHTSTTLTSDAAAGTTTLTVVDATGMLAGHPLILGSADTLDAPVIATVGRAGTAGTTITLTTALAHAHAAGSTATDAGNGTVLDHPVNHEWPVHAPARDLGSGVSLTRPLKRTHNVGRPVRDTGTGLTLATPLKKAHPDATQIKTVGTGITLDQPLTNAHAAATDITTTAVTVTPALGQAHASSASVIETGLKEPPLDTPLPAYWGFVLASLLAHDGAELQELPRPSASTYAFASTAANQRTVCLVNIDDTAPATITVQGIAAGSVQQWRYGLTSPDVRKTRTTMNVTQQLEPESILIIRGPATSATVKAGCVIGE